MCVHVHCMCMWMCVCVCVCVHVCLHEQEVYICMSMSMSMWMRMSVFFRTGAYPPPSAEAGPKHSRHACDPPLVSPRPRQVAVPGSRP